MLVYMSRASAFLPSHYLTSVSTRRFLNLVVIAFEDPHSLRVYQIFPIHEFDQRQYDLHQL